MDTIEHLFALKQARIEEVEREMKVFASRTVEIPDNAAGTHLFSAIELAYSYARRYVEFADAIKELLNAEKIVPATVLARALIETVAMGCLYLDDIERLIASKDKKRFEERLFRFYAGVKAGSGGDVKPVHVMDALRHFDDLDQKYIAYLEDKFGLFAKAADILGGQAGKSESYLDVLSAMRNYDHLSEISHPNGTGVQFLYPDPNLDSERVRDMLVRYREFSLASIWQAHHLLERLREVDGLADRYFAAFPS